MKNRCIFKQQIIKSPKLDISGLIHNTQIPYEVKLKTCVRVILTYNIDIVDSLVNSSMVDRVGFKKLQTIS